MPVTPEEPKRRGARERRAAPGRRAMLAALAAVVALVAVAPAAPSYAAPPPRASLTEVERQVMCVTCKIPLNVAESPQADRERAYIQELINEGKDEAQIKSALVGQYGRAVLGLPAASGFDLTVYLVPAAVVLGLLVLMVGLLTRWRRSGRSAPAQPPGSSPLSPGDAARLEADLSRFD
jgi:cytochrome c-type biogenesis protein CcmH